jgi:hypothetical protein
MSRRQRVAVCETVGDDALFALGLGGADELLLLLLLAFADFDERAA